MGEDKNTSVKVQAWTNPSIGGSDNSGLNEKVNNNTKEINELKNEVEFLKDELSKVTGKEIEYVKEESPVEEKAEINEPVDLPFNSPFTESTENVEEAAQDILESVKEEVKEEAPEVEENVPTFDDMLVEEEKVSVVVNRYNTDIEATTKGKGAKYISLTDAEHNKLLSGKINE